MFRTKRNTPVLNSNNATFGFGWKKKLLKKNANTLLYAVKCCVLNVKLLKSEQSSDNIMFKIITVHVSIFVLFKNI